MSSNRIPGTFIKLPKWYKSFIPNKLPPDIPWDVETISQALSHAHVLLGRLESEGKQLPDPRLFIMREAIFCSKLAGNKATLNSLLNAPQGEAISEDLQEVCNYVTALEYGLQFLKQQPLSLELIKGVHAQLMQNGRGSIDAGQFRTRQNWIGELGSTLETARLITPPLDYLGDCLSAFEKFLQDRTLPPLIHIALCHYQFEIIHPFRDGNGRIGRLLNTLLLVEQNVLSAPLLYLSGYFEATRDEYFERLYTVSSQGAWHEWVLYFLKGVALQAEDALAEIQRNKISS